MGCHFNRSFFCWDHSSRSASGLTARVAYVVDRVMDITTATGRAFFPLSDVPAGKKAPTGIAHQHAIMNIQFVAVAANWALPYYPSFSVSWLLLLLPGRNLASGHNLVGLGNPLTERIDFLQVVLILQLQLVITLLVHIGRHVDAILLARRVRLPLQTLQPLVALFEDRGALPPLNPHPSKKIGPTCWQRPVGCFE